MRKRIFLAAVAVALLSAGVANAAETITINVPVSVHKLMAPIGKVASLCFLLDSAGHLAWSNGNGQWTQIVPLDSTGSYSGTLTTTFTANPGTPKPASYYCSLSFLKADGTVYVEDLTKNGEAPNDDTTKHVSSAPYTPVVTGKIS